MNDNAIILTLIFRKKAQKKQVNSNFENLDSSKPGFVQSHQEGC